MYDATNAPEAKGAWRELYNEKRCTAQEAAAQIQSNQRIALSGGTCIPPAFSRALSDRAGDLKNILLSLGYTMDLYGFMDPANRESFFIETMFVGPVERICMQQGMAQYVPIHLADVPAYAETMDFDCIAHVVSPPDENGYMSRSLFAAFVNKELIKNTDRVVVEVNQNMPRLNSDDFMIHVSEVDHIIEQDGPVFEVPEITITEDEKKIAAYISDLINDGDTIQLGFGGLANAIGHNLMAKKDLGMYAEVVTPSVMELVKAGVINGKKKNVFPGKVVAAFAVGTQEFYDYIDGNEEFIFMDIGTINNPLNIAKNDNLVSINNALMIDLTGQAASESIGTFQYSGTGGQVNFVQGAKMAKNGRSVLALNSTFTNKKGEVKSKIVPLFPDGTVVTTPRTDVEYVVTEYGVANLRYQSIAKRVEALIAIAHPDFRDELREQAKRHKWI